MRIATEVVGSKVRRRIGSLDGARPWAFYNAKLHTYLPLTRTHLPMISCNLSLKMIYSICSIQLASFN